VLILVLQILSSLLQGLKLAQNDSSKLCEEPLNNSVRFDCGVSNGFTVIAAKEHSGYRGKGGA